MIENRLALFVYERSTSIDLTESGDAVVAHTKSEDHFELAMLVNPSRRGSGNERAVRIDPPAAQEIAASSA